MLKDIYAQVTESLIKQLEKGDLPAWVKPWKDRGGSGGIPVNEITGKEYQGINILNMWVTAEIKGFTSNAWGTFKQWSGKGEKIRAGEKATLGVYWNIQEMQDKKNPDETKKVPFLSSFNVFNKCQLQSYDPEKEEKREIKPLESRIEEVDKVVKGTGLVIEHGGDVACYIPSLDKIRMPHRSQFIEVQGCTPDEAYCGVLFHEMIHATGHQKRLNRDLSGKQNKQKYAGEEVIAETGASLLTAKYELEREPIPNQAKYIQGYLDVLKSEDGPKTFIQLVSQASKAVTYLHEHQIPSQLQ